MPSLRAFVLGLAFTFLTLIQLSATTPVPTIAAAAALLDLDCLPSRSSSTPTVPLSGEATELPPAPPAGQTFAYVALGRGVQNYTCANTTTAPVSIGAVATLFDGTALASANEAAFDALPAKAVYIPLTEIPAGIAASMTLGHHYFLADGTPTFDLSSKDKILYAKKNATITAPATADKGPAGTGAVPWLQLTAKPGYASVGLQTVYRVLTAGGNPPAVCPSVGVISVQYAAAYFFFE